MTTTERVIDIREDANHQLVGNQLSVVDKALCCLTQFRTFPDLVTQYVTR